MALQDIIQEIEKEKERKIKEIEAQKEKEILELKKRYEKELQEKREEILGALKEKLQKKIFAANEELKKKRELSILKEKRRILEVVQQTALAEIKSLKEEVEKEILTGLLRFAEKETEGISDTKVEIIPACGKEKLIKEVLVKLNKAYQVSSDCLKSSGGFVLKTERFNLDLTFENIFEMAKEETEREVAEILFG